MTTDGEPARSVTVRRQLENDRQFGSLRALAPYLNVGCTWLHALKKCATRRAREAMEYAGAPPNPSPFVGNKATPERIKVWLDRNPDFQPAKEYTRKPKE